jgi:mRNA interferase MazF
MTYKPASIALVPFPYSNLSAQKQRPVLILKEPDAYGDILCMAITSQTRLNLAVAIDQSNISSGRLRQKSWVRIDKLFTLNMQLFHKEIAVLEQVTFDKISRVLCQYLGCTTQ